MLDVLGSPWCPRRDLQSSPITDEDTHFEDGLSWSLQLQVGLTLRPMPSAHTPCLWRPAGLQGEGEVAVVPGTPGREFLPRTSFRETHEPIAPPSGHEEACHSRRASGTLRSTRRHSQVDLLIFHPAGSS